ncbi:hypothetical protein [Burkholderia thailandensis]|uniref:hypothetical protein n=1 Tax=Burkholderia thailandensis TaxID=57975 RepID=UPI000AECCA43|nr:hypothetical protein [Burkholderia thailandensis]MBS2128939.1 hypothetical protein [Burkholderia thailandensis]MCS3396964.1 hypothetical protein [Burkholderia thailandensis]MCS6468854.1 hypothetical protein [Burkholderia thailandensis]MCS6476280.1 hypothetical protein [Burkholderia thailandensis]MCS6500308.1 hypothetical protein [Burkholderia thailandensis]
MRALAARSPRTRRARSDAARYGPRRFAGAFVFPTRAARAAAPLPAVIGGALRQTAVSPPHDDRVGTIRQNQRKSLTTAFPIDPTRAASRDGGGFHPPPPSRAAHRARHRGFACAGSVRPPRPHLRRAPARHAAQPSLVERSNANSIPD